MPGCGLISSWFVSDLCLKRDDALAKHTVAAIGSSSEEKGRAFANKHCPTQSPAIYSSYSEVYNDPNVDIIYIGTPHVFHYRNTLDAIAAGKHVLCEKPIAMNAQQAKEMAGAAREKNVFLMEAVWTRFFPIAKELERLIHEEKIIGDVAAAWFEFGLDMPIKSLDSTSRTASKALGAGALLDIGIYTLTWASIVMGSSIPEITASMIFSDAATQDERVDEQVTAILRYPSQKAQAICTASMLFKTPDVFARIEGSKGTICIGGLAASKPGYLVIKEKEKDERKIDFDVPGIGFHYEADAVAADIHAGKIENDTCSLNTTLGILSQMDSIMEICGHSYSTLVAP